MKLTLLVSISFFFECSYLHIDFINFTYAIAETATPSQSLMVLRCCGNLVPDELPENRTILAKKIWDTLNYIGIKSLVIIY